MKTKLKLPRWVLISCLFGIFSSISSFGHGDGGGGVGNGGGVVVCTQPGVTGFTSEAHDLYEGRAIRNLSYGYVRSLSYKKLDRYLDHVLAPKFSEKKIYKRSKAEVFSNLFSTSPESEAMKNVVTEDLEGEFREGKITLGPNCTIKNLFRYYDNGTVLNEKSLMVGFVNYDNEFLILQKHELLYFLARRKFQDKNSERARELLSYAASDQIRNEGPELEKFKSLLEAWWSQ